jgi:hypothetical protein
LRDKELHLNYGEIGVKGPHADVEDYRRLEKQHEAKEAAG